MLKYSNAWRALKKSSPVIFTGLSVVGVIATGILSTRAGMKAERIISEKTKKNPKIGMFPKEHRREVIESTWKCYIPPVLCGTGTVASIIFSHCLNAKQIAGLTATAAVISDRYSKYRQGLEELIDDLENEEDKQKIRREISNRHQLGAANQVIDIPPCEDEDLPLFYETISGQFFRSTVERVQSAEYHANRNLSLRGHVPFNEWLDFLGIFGGEGYRYDNDYGWDVSDMLENWDTCWLDFDHHDFVTPGGETATAINYPMEPIFLDYA